MDVESALVSHLLLPINTSQNRLTKFLNLRNKVKRKMNAREKMMRYLANRTRHLESRDQVNLATHFHKDEESLETGLDMNTDYLHRKRQNEFPSAAQACALIEMGQKVPRTRHEASFLLTHTYKQKYNFYLLMLS